MTHRILVALLAKIVGGARHDGDEAKESSVAQFNPAEFRRKLREAERKAQRELQREVDRVNRENQRRIDAFNREQQRKVDAHNRRVQQHNERVVREYNQDVAKVNAHNQRANRQNAATIAELNRRLRTTVRLGTPRPSGRSRTVYKRRSAGRTTVSTTCS